MKSFSDENGASDGEIGLAGNIRSGAKICRNSDTLDNGGQRDEFLGGGHWKAVGTGFDWLGSSSGETSLKVENMTFLVVCNVLEFVVEAGWKSSGSEFVNTPLGQSFLVEVVL